MLNTCVYDETPTELIPKMGEFQVSDSTYYKQLLMSSAARDSGTQTALAGQIDPIGQDDSFEEQPATGVLLTFDHQWIRKGLALRELRKSVCLAPGEVTKLAVVDWSRETRSLEVSERRESEVVRSEMVDTTAA